MGLEIGLTFGLPGFDQSLTRTEDGGTIDGASREEIDDGLHPKDVPIVAHINEACPHIVDGHKTVDSERRRDSTARRRNAGRHGKDTNER